MGSFRLTEGMSVSNLDGLHECYEVKERNGTYVFKVNVSAENIAKLIQSFCIGLDEPCFFILEVPTNEKDELELRKKNTDSFHCDVFYWDGLSTSTLLEIVDKYGELLINDGMTCFGFASHHSHDEIYLGRYNIVSIFASDVFRYKDLLDGMSISEEEQIKTVWDNFSKDAPGQTRRIEIGGQDIYSLIDELKNRGLYFAERREQ